ncbi:MULTISPECIES: GNAT family N-acetyltransferase [unclassified Iodidimonas]|jgi:RimJ/RimL family protein N-acetyltransferase|uniref:GNAT family N-acetyltransferase n=1 Tax=unclassified Iodidimonas TaxID=2626145 RepID=UPI002482EDDB|nr:MULTISPECIES: GNAT family N-acetyltransferase [unclassified Iodidimonas]
MNDGAARSAIPQLETARLVLRAPQKSDLDASALMWGDPAVVRFTSGQPIVREDVWRRILCYRGLWDMLGYGYWAVFQRTGGTMIGEVGFADFKRGLGDCLDGLPEIGWSFSTEAQGQGFAREAVQAALSWIDRHLPGTDVGCLIHIDNARSFRLAGHCGFQECARLPYRGNQVAVLRRAALTPALDIQQLKDEHQR